MNLEDNLITGIIPNAEKTILFSADKENFTFSFMTDSFNNHFGAKERAIEVPSKDGFIYGKTHDMADIAIYVGDKNLSVVGSELLNTYSFVKSNCNVFNHDMSTFKVLKFHGGILNTIFRNNALKIECLKLKEYTIKCNDDSIKYSAKADEIEFDVNISSEVVATSSVKGDSITNNKAIMKLEFKKAQPLRSLFKHYNCIKDMLSFMVFWGNVYFDAISIENMEQTPTMEMPITATVYVKSESIPIKKYFDSIISFDDIKSELAQITQLFYAGVTNADEYICLGFFPESDKDVYYINERKVRAICSSLECELSYIPGFIKKGIYKDNQWIFSSKKKATPLKDKLCALFDIYRDELKVLCSPSDVITYEDIAEFVKYRNAVTHGRHQVIDRNIATTAFCMCGLIYCCVLTRAGVPREKLKPLLKKRILS